MAAGERRKTSLVSVCLQDLQFSFWGALIRLNNHNYMIKTKLNIRMLYVRWISSTSHDVDFTATHVTPRKAQ